MRAARRYADLWILCAILLLAGVLRLGWPGLTEFKADEARLLTLAYDMANGRFAARGISSSVGFPNFPMSVWLYALPVALWRHPYSATLFTGLLNSLAVAGCYLFTRRYWGRTAAVTAALMLAVSPWAVIFSRKIWAQNLLPLVVMGWGGSAALALGEGRRRLVALHLLLLAVAVQIHLAAAALLPATAVLLLLYRRRVAWRWAGAGGLLGLATAAPFLAYLWQNQAAGSGFAGGAASGGLSLDAFRLTAALSLGQEIHALAGPDAFAAYLAQLPPMAPVYAVWSALVGGGAALLAHQAWRGRATPDARPDDRAARCGAASLVVLLWLLAPPLAFTWRGTPIFIHYFIATLPAQYVAAGAAAGWLLARLRPRRAVRALCAGGIGVTLLAQLLAFGALLAFVGQRATPGGFGAPLARQLAGAETAVAALEAGDAAEILVAGAGETPRLDAFPAVMAALLDGVPHRYVDVRRSALFPAAGAVVLLENDLDAPLAETYAAAAAARQAVALRAGEGALTVLTLPPAAAPAPERPFAETYLFNNWVNPFGYEWQRSGKTATYTLHWRTGGNPDPADYHFFNHLLLAGVQTAQADAAAFSAGQWRAGDVVLSRFVLDYPTGAGEVMLRTGMYRYPSLEPVLLLDVAGNPYSDAIEIDKLE